MNKKIEITLLFIIISLSVQSQNKFFYNFNVFGFDSLKIELYKDPTWNWNTNCQAWDLKTICNSPMIINPGEPYSLFTKEEEDSVSKEIDRRKIQDISRRVMKEPYPFAEEWYLDATPYSRNFFSRTQRVFNFFFEGLSRYSLPDLDDLDYMVGTDSATGHRSMYRMNGMDDDFSFWYPKANRLDYFSVPSSSNLIWKKKY
jgi:hypothetical protein